MCFPPPLRFTMYGAPTYFWRRRSALLRTRSRRSEYVVNTTTDLTSQGFDLVHWNCIEASERLLHQYACAQSFACKPLAGRAPRWLAGDAVALHARHTARLESFTSGYLSVPFRVNC